MPALRRVLAGGSGSFTPEEDMTFHGVRCQGLDRLTGTFAKTSGSPTITGTGTAFLTQIKPGYALWDSTNSVQVGIVLSIATDTSLTLAANASASGTGLSGQPDQPVADATFAAVKYEYDPDVHTSLGGAAYDTNGYHFSSSAALTGTVSKNGTTTVTGSGTSFLSELSVNQAFQIPGGGGTDTVLVRSIESNTSLTIWRATVYTASGQTGTRDPSVVGIPEGWGGYYDVFLEDDWRYGVGTFRGGNVIVNFPGGTLTPGYGRGGTNTARVTTSGETAYGLGVPVLFAEGDMIQNFVYQDSGGSLNLTPMYSFALSYRGIP